MPTPTDPARPTDRPTVTPYEPRHRPREQRWPVRGLHVHARHWHDDAPGAAARPLLVLLHGWMDVGASFQFMVDTMQVPRRIVAPDWRGFGGSAPPPGHDTYWFADYVADLDALLDHWSPDAPVDLVGHSMGGNVAMHYAGIRPQRVRRLVNLEGFGMPRTRPEDAAARFAQWLDELKKPPQLAGYDGADGVARRLMKNNPRLPADKAAWLAAQWAAPGSDGRWQLRADPAHKGVSPLLYRADEAVAVWRRIAAPLLFVDGALTDLAAIWGTRYTREEFEARLAEVQAPVTRARLPASGHMLHHDEPEALAAHLERFLDGAG